MITLEINGKQVEAREGDTIYSAATRAGIRIPKICYDEELSAYGACRLCIVEIGEEPRVRLVSSCTYPAEQGLKVKTDSPRVLRTRKMTIELYMASCPNMKVVQDLAKEYGVERSRFKKETEDCLMCGLCVRRSKEQHLGKRIQFYGRGNTRGIGEPYSAGKKDTRPCGRCAHESAAPKAD